MQKPVGRCKYLIIYDKMQIRIRVKNTENFCVCALPLITISSMRNEAGSNALKIRKMSYEICVNILKYEMMLLEKC